MGDSHSADVNEDEIKKSDTDDKRISIWIILVRI